MGQKLRLIERILCSFFSFYFFFLIFLQLNMLSAVLCFISSTLVIAVAKSQLPHNEWTSEIRIQKFDTAIDQLVGYLGGNNQEIQALRSEIQVQLENLKKDLQKTIDETKTEIQQEMKEEDDNMKEQLKDHKNDVQKEIDESKTEIQKVKEEDENIKKQLKEKDEDIKRQFKEQKEDLQKEIDESKTEIQEEIENQKGEPQKEIKDGDTNLKEHFDAKIHGINKELAYLESLEIKGINGTLNDHMTEFFLSKAQLKKITDKINADLGHLESANRELLNESEARGKELLSQEKSYLQAEMATKLNQVRHRLYRQRESLLQDIEAGDKRIQALDQLQNEMTAKINGLDNKFSNLDSSLCQMGTVGCVDNCGGKGGPSMYSTLYEG